MIDKIDLTGVMNNVGEVLDGLSRIKSPGEADIKELKNAADGLERELDRSKALMADIDKNIYKPTKSYELASSHS